MARGGADMQHRGLTDGHRAADWHKCHLDDPSRRRDGQRDEHVAAPGKAVRVWIKSYQKRAKKKKKKKKIVSAKGGGDKRYGRQDLNSNTQKQKNKNKNKKCLVIARTPGPRWLLRRSGAGAGRERDRRGSRRTGRR
jgi:hypothetical protein